MMISFNKKPVLILALASFSAVSGVCQNAASDSPYGPFTYQGTFMEPVTGWTTHYSIVEFKGKWYIFYHDVELSGKTHLRNIKVRELIKP